MLGQVYLELQELKDGVMSARAVRAVGWNPASNSEAGGTQFRTGGTGGEDASELAGPGIMCVGTLDHGRISLESLEEAATSCPQTLRYFRLYSNTEGLVSGLERHPLSPMSPMPCTIDEELMVLVSIVRVMDLRRVP